MSQDLVYVIHSDPAVAAKLDDGLQSAGYEVVRMTSVSEAQAIITGRQFMLPDAILTPLGDMESGDSILITLFQSNPLMEQIPLVVVATSEKEERRRVLRMGLLSVVFPPYDDEEVSLTTKIAIDKHRNDQLLFGSLSQLSVPDLLQMAEVGRRSGTISFQHNGDRATVWLRDGLVVDAEIEDRCEAEEAVYAVALWTTGTFEANFGAVDVDDRFAIPPSELVLEAMRRLDEEQAATRSEPIKADDRAAALDLALTLLNVVASYAINHLEPRLVRERNEAMRCDLLTEHPSLAVFEVTEKGPITLDDRGPMEFSRKALAEAVGAWIRTFFEALESSLAWRFSPQRLARLLGQWRWEMHTLGFLEPMGVADADESQGDEEDVHLTGKPTGQPIPIGCLVLDGDGYVEAFAPYGPRIGNLTPDSVVGKPLDTVLRPRQAGLVERLEQEMASADEGSESRCAVGEEVLTAGHEDVDIRMAVIRLASKHGRVVTVNRLRHHGCSLAPKIERDPLTGTLWDAGEDRVLIANHDFLLAFEGLFSRSLSHRHHELLQRFGKRWGLRHAMRLEELVQRDYGMTLREMESQMALELLSSSIGVLGLGSFTADLGFRDSGLVVITHQSSPFPGLFEGSAGGACSIMSGFHAAILSYLAGRQLAAREVRCSPSPGSPCLFVVATEDRLTKLLIATPGSADHDLMSEIFERAGGGYSQ